MIFPVRYDMKCSLKPVSWFTVSLQSCRVQSWHVWDTQNFLPRAKFFRHFHTVIAFKQVTHSTQQPLVQYFSAVSTYTSLRHGHVKWCFLCLVYFFISTSHILLHILSYSTVTREKNRSVGKLMKTSSSVCHLDLRSSFYILPILFP